MRILLVWVVAITLMFAVSLGWYVSQPIVLGISRQLSTSMNAQGQTVTRGIEYASYAWGPILNLFIFLWAIISSSKHDVYSEIYD